jgi:uncharacterized phage-associated protein
MERVDARVVANSLLDLADRRAISLSQMQVQKLVYLSHGWHYVACGTSLIRNDFEAWEYGPVVKTLYGALRQYGDAKIDGRALWYDALRDKWALAAAQLAQPTLDVIERVFDRYGKMSAFQLSSLTHEQGSPWHDVWYSTAGIGNFGMRIPEQLIREYFDRLSRTNGSILLT